MGGDDIIGDIFKCHESSESLFTHTPLALKTTVNICGFCLLTLCSWLLFLGNDSTLMPESLESSGWSGTDYNFPPFPSGNEDLNLTGQSIQFSPLVFKDPFKNA